MSVVLRGHAGAWAVYSDAEPGCERIYRYRLVREWSDRPLAVWCLLNPSYAGHEVLDPTSHRVRDFSHRWGYGGFEIVNLFARSATDPADLFWDSATDPVGPENDIHIAQAFATAGIIIAGWGSNKMVDRRPDRVDVIRGLAIAAGAPLHTLGVADATRPPHPLYLPKTSTPVVWTPK